LVLGFKTPFASYTFQYIPVCSFQCSNSTKTFANTKAQDFALLLQLLYIYYFHE